MHNFLHLSALIFLWLEQHESEYRPYTFLLYIQQHQPWILSANQIVKLMPRITKK